MKSIAGGGGGHPSPPPKAAHGAISYLEAGPHGASRGPKPPWPKRTGSSFRAPPGAQMSGNGGVTLMGTSRIRAEAGAGRLGRRGGGLLGVPFAGGVVESHMEGGREGGVVVPGSVWERRASPPASKAAGGSIPRSRKDAPTSSPSGWASSARTVVVLPRGDISPGDAAAEKGQPGSLEPKWLR